MNRASNRTQTALHDSNVHSHRHLITSLVAAAALLGFGALSAQAGAHQVRRDGASTARQEARLRHCRSEHARRSEHGDCGRSARYRREAARRSRNERRDGTRSRNSRAATPAAQAPPVTPAPTIPLATPGPEGCAETELVPSTSNIEQVREATLCLINQQREEHGEVALIENAKLDAAAQGHSEDMVTRDYFEHTTPTGEEFQTRIIASGYVPRGAAYELGENIDTATLYLASPAATVTAWMNSPEHRANILNGEFRETGMGIAAAAPPYFAEGAAGATYTQDFAVLAGNAG